jgi:transposase
MSQFPTHRHQGFMGLKMCPGKEESRLAYPTLGQDPHGLKVAQERADRGGPRRGTLEGGTYLAAQYARLKGRRGPKKAAVAVGHSILVIAYHILQDEVPYEELRENHFDQCRSNEAYAKRLVRQLQDRLHWGNRASCLIFSCAEFSKCLPEVLQECATWPMLWPPDVVTMLLLQSH